MDPYGGPDFRLRASLPGAGGFSRNVRSRRSRPSDRLGRLRPALGFSWFSLVFLVFLVFLVPFWFSVSFRFSVFQCHPYCTNQKDIWLQGNIFQRFLPARGRFGHPHKDFWSPGGLRTSDSHSGLWPALPGLGRPFPALAGLCRPVRPFRILSGPSRPWPALPGPPQGLRWLFELYGDRL